MPSFGDPFTGLSLDRPLSKEELIRSIRFMIAAEYEAVEMYGRVADATQDEKIKKAIMDIVEEERVHAGEFMKMLTILDPEEAKFYQEGFKEVEEGMGKQSISNLLRMRAGKTYLWQGLEKRPELKEWDKMHPALKTMMYKSPFTGKKFHVSPSASNKSIEIEVRGTGGRGFDHKFIISDQKKAIKDLTGREDITDKQIQALKDLGFMIHEKEAYPEIK